MSNSRMCKPRLYRSLRLILGVLIIGLGLQGAYPASYQEARTLAFEGEREAARQMCLQLLQEKPDHKDVRVLLGRLYAWDKSYDFARAEFSKVLAGDPTYRDAASALADVELWTDHPDRALEVIAPALEAHPDAADLWFRKARAHRALEQEDQALAAAERARSLDPEDASIAALLSRIQREAYRNRIRLDGEYEDFDDSTDPWKSVSLALNRKFDWGTGIARLNLAERFNQDGVQFELDAYPKIPAARSYLYFNAGVSNDDIFPELRFGAEWFKNFSDGWEASIGGRHLQFENSDVTLWTGSIGKYFGQNFVWIRPFWSDKDEGTSVSGTLFWRRYFNDDRYSHFTVSVGAGSSPDDDLTTPEVNRLDSQRVGLEWQRRFKEVWAYRLRASWRDEEFIGGDRERLSWGVGIQRWF